MTRTNEERITDLEEAVAKLADRMDNKFDNLKDRIDRKIEKDDKVVADKMATPEWGSANRMKKQKGRKDDDRIK
jgi:hypothetical protein